MMQSKQITQFIRILLGFTFIVSGIVKLFPVDVLEINIVRFSGFSWLYAQYIARILIGFEIALGILIITGLYNKIIIQVTLVTLCTFSIFLVYLHFIVGYTQSCGCFGALISLKPVESLLKNIVLLGFTLFLIKKDSSPIHIQKTYTKLFTLIILIVGCAIPFIFAYPNKKITSNYTVTESSHIHNETLRYVTDNHNKTHSLLEGKKLIVFLSTSCKACKLAATKLAVLVNPEPEESSLFFIFLESNTIIEELIEFHEETQSGHIPYTIFDIQSFFSISDVYLPFLLYLENGKIRHISNYSDMNPRQVISFFSTQ